MTDAVAVVGPASSGVTSVLSALTIALPDVRFVEAGDLGEHKPSTVVFVVSASAPLVDSDCEILDLAARTVDSVVAAVSKIDIHRNWREVLAANREVWAARSGRSGSRRSGSGRPASVQWVGVAAAPELCGPVLQPLVDAIGQVLADPTLTKRNELRGAEAELSARIEQMNDDVERLGSQAEILRRQRTDLVRARRQRTADQAIALRKHINEARIQTGAYVRRRCLAARTELLQMASAVKRSQVRSFPDDVDRYVRRTVGEIDAEMRRQLGAHTRPAGEYVEIGRPVMPRRLESRLVALLGAGFGLGVALSVGRLLEQLKPGWNVAAIATSAFLGIGLTTWVVATRGLLQRRLMFERWIADEVAAVRSHLEDRLAADVLAAEFAMTAAAAQRDAAQRLHCDEVVAAVDRDIRMLVAQSARANAYRDRHLPAIESELAGVRAEFGRN